MPGAEMGAWEQAEPGMELGWHTLEADERVVRTLKVTPSDQRATPLDDGGVEELKRRRRQDQACQAQLMTELSGKNERQEKNNLATMFSEQLPQFKSESDGRSSAEGSEPKARIFLGPDLVDTQIGGEEDAIDFGLRGVRITRRDFVGLRQIQHFSQVPPLPATFVPASDPTLAETATRLATSLGSSLEGAWQWLSDQRPFGLSLPSPQHILPPAPLVLPADAASSTDPNGLLDDTHFQAAAARAASADGLAQEQSLERKGSSKEPLEGAFLGGALREHRGSANGGAEEQQQDGDDDMSKWEILWKDHTMPGLPLRRLEFSCNRAGEAVIQERLSGWQELARSSQAIVEASQAALQACGREALPENPGVWLPTATSDATLLQGREEAAGAEQAELSGEQVTISLSECGDEDIRGSCGRELETSAELAAWGVKGGDNAIRWGSVQVVGKFMPSRNGNSLILRPGHFMALSAALPARLRGARWSLNYSTARDGISLATLYRKVSAQKGPCLLFVRDSQKYVFGSFTSEEWKPLGKYYGNGECFVFQAVPEIQAFRWSRDNSFFMFSTATTLAIGGGNHYAFSLNSDLLSGSSSKCDTFGSVPLSGSEEFEAELVEVWGLR